MNNITLTGLPGYTGNLSCLVTVIDNLTTVSCRYIREEVDFKDVLGDLLAVIFGLIAIFVLSIAFAFLCDNCEKYYARKSREEEQKNKIEKLVKLNEEKNKDNHVMGLNNQTNENKKFN